MQSRSGYYPLWQTYLSLCINSVSSDPRLGSSLSFFRNGKPGNGHSCEFRFDEADDASLAGCDLAAKSCCRLSPRYVYFILFQRPCVGPRRCENQWWLLPMADMHLGRGLFVQVVKYRADASCSDLNMKGWRSIL